MRLRSPRVVPLQRNSAAQSQGDQRMRAGGDDGRVSPRRGWSGAGLQVDVSTSGRPPDSTRGMTPRAFVDPSDETTVRSPVGHTVVRVTSPRTTIRFISVEESDSFGSPAPSPHDRHGPSAEATSSHSSMLVVGEDGMVSRSPRVGAATPRGGMRTLETMETGEAREEDGLLASGKIRSLSSTAPRSINLFWVEKLMVIIDCCQAYALLWNISTQWPWPTYWLNFTYYVGATAADFFTFATGVPRHGEPRQLHGYLGYATLALLIPAGLLLPLFAGMELYPLSLKTRARLFLCMDLFCHTALIPVGLAIGRLTACSTGMRFLFDESVACDGGMKAVVNLYSFVGFLVLSVTYPLLVTRRIRRGILYDRPQDHETYIQGIEIEYMTGLSKEWAHAHLWLFSSFHRSHAYYWVYHTYYKLALVLISWMSWNGMQGAQSFLFWFVVILWTVYNTLTTPFRCGSTKTTACLVNWTLFIISLFGMLTGNNVKSAFVVASTQTIILLLFGCLGTAALLTQLGHLAFFERVKGSDIREEWPTNKTYRRLVSNHDVLRWIDTMKAAHDVIAECTAYAPELAPMHDVEAVMSKVHECWVQARRRGSIMENTLRVTLDELASVHRRFRGVSILPGKNNKVLNTLTEFGSLLKNRSKVQALMNPKKRRLLLKILAMRLFIGDRNVASANNLEDAIRMDQKKASEQSSKSWSNIQRLSEANAKETAEMLAAFEDLAFLQGKTEQLLAAPDASVKDAIIACRNAWKKVIRHWETSYEQQFGHKPTLDDKETKRQWYEAYKALAIQSKVLSAPPQA